MSTGVSQEPALPFVYANLNFFNSRITEPNDFRWTPTRENERPSNLSPPDTHLVKIYDLRSLSVDERTAAGLTLEEAGFETIEGWIGGGEEIGKGWVEKKWEDLEWIEGVYKPYVKRSVISFFMIATKF